MKIFSQILPKGYWISRRKIKAYPSFIRAIEEYPGNLRSAQLRLEYNHADFRTYITDYCYHEIRKRVQELLSKS